MLAQSLPNSANESGQIENLGMVISIHEYIEAKLVPAMCHISMSAYEIAQSKSHW